jgi:hypothetical protein
MKHALVLVLAIGVAAGCDASSPSVDPVGAFVLADVDGKSLPTSFGPTDAGGPWYVRGTLDVRANGSYIETVVDSSRSTGRGTVVENGTWMRFGADSVRFTSTTAGRESSAGNVSGNDLARRHFARVFRFRRP